MAYTWTLKDKIFGYFGISSKVNDSYKDINGKGIKERYQESLAQEYDDNLGVLVDQFIDRTINVDLAEEKFIVLIENMLGINLNLYDNQAFRRKFIKIWQSIVLIKSTRLSYEVLYNLIGVTVDDIILIDTDSGFDSSYTLDDDDRKFDSGAFCCRHYELHFSGPAISDELSNLIVMIAMFLHPIDSEIDDIVYNGSSIL